jgi:hypothetical protein
MNAKSIIWCCYLIFVSMLVAMAMSAPEGGKQEDCKILIINVLRMENFD